MRFLSPKDISSIQDRIQSHKSPRARSQVRIRPDLTGKTVALRLSHDHVFYNCQAVVLGQRLADGAFKVLISGSSVIAYFDAQDINTENATFGRA